MLKHSFSAFRDYDGQTGANEQSSTKVSSLVELVVAEAE